MFFVLAAIPAIGGLTLAALTSTYLSMFLVALMLFIVPINLNFDSIAVPLYGSISQIPLFISLVAFALAGHFSIYEVRRLIRDEKTNIRVFFAAFAFAFLSYAAFGITTAGTSPNLSELSTATLTQIYPPFYAFLVSAIALLAFYTSFIVVSHSFTRVFESYVPKKTIYALLLLPVALLYMLVREYKVLSLTTLVARLGGVSLLLFLALACFAHNKATEKWKTNLPRPISKILGMVFVAAGFIGLFL